ncbi:hypothetical protein N7582_000386 [Saccharomyces uvarum]|uniref:PRELI/MSF1 domain-containing protein n=1 Tax=Saccharomyces uvarum TaxID=230603 RepID=A0AA35JB82_SACUV|nr:hypothetical protein N7582_000386 [Saccharomyces uvarum]CAI4055619.1 hypothetical protein SUVC_02G3110 [Saccharomyces uvarum]
MKSFQKSYEFDYPWEKVTTANWMKYPNKSSTHVIAVDVLRRELQEHGDVLLTERLITISQNAPRWMSILVGNTNLAYVREVSTIDRRNRSMTMRSCNMTFPHILKCYETVTYAPHPKNPSNMTLFKQDAKFISGIPTQIFSRKVENWGVKRFSDNAMKGKVGFDSILEMFNDIWSNGNE